MFLARAVLVGCLALGCLAAPLAVDAQQTGKVPSVGLLGVTSRTLEEALRQGPLGAYQWVAALFSEDLRRVSPATSAPFTFQ